MTTSEHYHIDASDDGPECADDVFAALNQADFYVDGRADFEHDGITAMGDAGDFEGAYRAFQASEELSAVVLNIRNITDHHYGRKDRAPLYPDTEEGNARLHESALHIVDMVNASSARVTIYPAPYVDGECEQPEEEESTPGDWVCEACGTEHPGTTCQDA